MTNLTTIVEVAVTTMTERAVGAGFGGLANVLRRRQKPTDGGSDGERAAAAGSQGREDGRTAGTSDSERPIRRTRTADHDDQELQHGRPG